MARPARLTLVATVVLLAGAGGAARAVDTEHRDFTILVDGKTAGQSRVTVVQQDDGSAYMKATASVKLQGLFAYNFSIDAEEWWKGGKLIALKAHSEENRKRTDVAVSGDGKQLVVNVNGQARTLDPDIWTTSYWKLADARFHNNKIAILETDTGTLLAGQLQYVGTEKLTVGTALKDCYHFRVTGIPAPIDLWYDQFHRLVRQEFTESGHRTIVQLDAIRR
jgi:hypothetical protein